MCYEKGEPFIGYHVKGSDEVIPVAGIGIREDGVGYGGQFKFEMTLHKGFAEHLKNANQAIYKNKNEEYNFLSTWYKIFYLQSFLNTLLTLLMHSFLRMGVNI